MSFIQFSLLQDIPDHHFIQTAAKPRTGVVSNASLLAINYYLPQITQSLSQWRKDKRLFQISHDSIPNQKKQSKQFNYILFSEFIRTHGYFDPFPFDLPDLHCFWLDHSLDIKTNTYISQNGESSLGINSGVPQQQYGSTYPINAVLKREGHLYTTFQPQLLQRITNERQRLIDNSNDALKDSWVFDLRGLISDTISLIDITLTQTYIKAEYDPQPGWKFDRELLGQRHGRRLNDKLKWIHQITGNNLNIESEVAAFNVLKELRNHLMHFDPPSLVITIEEVTNWLNYIIDIGNILLKIRKAINVPVSTQLINLLLQKEAVFVPYTTGKRESLKAGENYYSSVWPKNND